MISQTQSIDTEPPLTGTMATAVAPIELTPTGMLVPIKMEPLQISTRLSVNQWVSEPTTPRMLNQEAIQMVTTTCQSTTVNIIGNTEVSLVVLIEENLKSVSMETHHIGMTATEAERTSPTPTTTLEQISTVPHPTSTKPLASHGKGPPTETTPKPSLTQTDSPSTNTTKSIHTLRSITPTTTLRPMLKPLKNIINNTIRS